MIPPREIENIIDNIGIPNGGFNLAFGDSPTIGVSDGDILISLNQEEHGSTAEYTDRLRKRLNQKFPEVTFFFEAANITNQILNFGLPAPIDVQVLGRNTAANYQIASELQRKIEQIPGAADVHIHQVVDYPEIRVNVDRSKAGLVGLTQRDVSSSMLISLSGSSQISPTQWLDYTTGVSYNVTVQTPQYRINSIDSLMRTPISSLASAVNTQYRDISGGRGQCRECRGRSRSQPGVGGLRQSRCGLRRTATALQSCGYLARRGAGNHQSLQRAAGVRRLRQPGPARPRLGRHARGAHRERDVRQTAAGHHHRSSRPDRHHAEFFLPPGTRPAFRDRSGVPADGGQLPILARSVYHSDGAARARWRVSSGCCL